MKKFIKVTLIVVGSLFICVTAFAVYQFSQWDLSLFKQEWNETDGTVLANLSYGTAERNRFDLYLPAGIDKKRDNGIILFVHGGSWNSGRKEDMAWACKRYAKEGYITATMNYTLVGENSKGSIKGMDREIKACVEALRHTADSLGVNVGKMAIGGYSAGGHLAMLYAFTHRHDSAIPLAFCISYVGPSDMNFLFPVNSGIIYKANQELQSGVKGETCKAIDGMIYSMTGDLGETKEYKAEEMDSILRSISPITYISDGTLPAVFAYGAKDQLVRIPHADSLEARYQRHGGTFEMIRFPNSGHELGRDSECVERLNKTVSDFAKKYFGY